MASEASSMSKLSERAQGVAVAFHLWKVWFVTLTTWTMQFTLWNLIGESRFGVSFRSLVVQSHCGVSSRGLTEQSSLYNLIVQSPDASSWCGLVDRWTWCALGRSRNETRQWDSARQTLEQECARTKMPVEQNKKSLCGVKGLADGGIFFGRSLCRRLQKVQTLHSKVCIPNDGQCTSANLASLQKPSNATRLNLANLANIMPGSHNRRLHRFLVEEKLSSS